MKVKLLFLPLTLVFAGACTQNVKTHGHMLQEQQVEAIRIGLDGKQEVQRLLGTPTFKSSLNDNIWYYLMEKRETKPLNPDILQKRELLEVTFDNADKVATLERKDQTSGKDIEPSQNITPTQGQSLGVMEQLLENAGKGGF